MSDNWKNGIIRQLDSQIAMSRKDFTLWMKGEIEDKEYSFRMSNHLASFSEILKNRED